MTTTTEIPELTYFAGPGRAQLTRLVFAAGGVEFKDTRHSFEEWAKIKADPECLAHKGFGQMPFLTHGDVLIFQSHAVAQYAAEIGINKNRKWANEALNRATDKMVLDTHKDVQSAMYKCLFGSDEGKKAGLEALPEATNKLVGGLERIIERSQTEGSPLLFSSVEQGPSLGDLAIYDLVTSPFPGLKALGQDLSAFPKVNALVEAVSGLTTAELVG